MVNWRDGPNPRRKGGQCLRKRFRSLSTGKKTPSVSIPLTEARGARAAASCSSCVKLARVTERSTGKRAARLSKCGLHRMCVCLSNRCSRLCCVTHFTDTQCNLSVKTIHRVPIHSLQVLVYLSSFGYLLLPSSGQLASHLLLFHSCL